mmetsp:Transcript_5743/g.9885  ORF Transcript_5743/g.9885 Transcript_5743/m.9885 type:complete len:86 (-) Transcript_5743:223-480(-)
MLLRDLQEEALDVFTACMIAHGKTMHNAPIVLLKNGARSNDMSISACTHRTLPPHMHACTHRDFAQVPLVGFSLSIAFRVPCALT